MKIALLATGTLGDVDLFLALALGFQDLGHRVTLVVPQSFEAYIKPFKVPYQTLSRDVQQLFEPEQGGQWMASGNAKAFMKQLNLIIHHIRHDLQRDILAACQDSDAMIFHPLLLFEAAVVSEKLQKPFMFVFPFPFMPATTKFPQLFVRAKRLPLGILNWLTYRIFANIHERSKIAAINEWRIQLDLTPFRGSYYKQLEAQQVPILHAYSSALVPFPEDWGKHNFISGAVKLAGNYLSHYAEQQTTVELMTWLDQGSTPVYFDFGRLPVPDPQKMLEMIIEMTKQLQTRAIIESHWIDITIKGQQLPNSIFVTKPIDHHWLFFPHCSCIIHHGGAYTTHRAAEAGTPSIICSVYADQPFWGERVATHNIGRHIPLAKLTQTKLIQAIRELQSDSIKTRAAEMGNRIKKENGLQWALEWVERQLPTVPIYRNEVE
jgi:sterol 3beta-glucosyltransferase